MISLGNWEESMRKKKSCNSFEGMEGIGIVLEGWNFRESS